MVMNSEVNQYKKKCLLPIAITRKPLLVFWPVFVAITIEAHHKKSSKWMVVISNFSRLHNLMKSLIRERDKNLGNCKKFSLQLQSFATFSLSPCNLQQVFFIPALPESCKLNPKCWHLASCHTGSQEGYFDGLRLCLVHFAWQAGNLAWRISPLCSQILPKWLKQWHPLRYYNLHSILWIQPVQPGYHNRHEYVCL